MTSRRRITTRSRWAIPLLLAGALTFLAGCGGSTETGAPTTTSTSTTTTTTAPDPGAKPEDGTQFCAIFQGLSARAQSAGDGFERYPDEAAWTAGVENVQQIAASAPSAIANQAATYAQLVEERKGLAASYGYQPVPQSAKLEFGRAHAAMQQQANQLIAFAKANCSGVV